MIDSGHHTLLKGIDIGSLQFLLSGQFDFTSSSNSMKTSLAVWVEVEIALSLCSVSSRKSVQFTASGGFFYSKNCFLQTFLLAKKPVVIQLL